tara:strand:- start:91 stop:531 length:441 start_codon:yes stop_codon:yes gene_type:complete
MGEVFQIGITQNSGEEIINANSILAIAGKGLENDRFAKKNNDKGNQLTIIQKEIIDEYNKNQGTSIPYINFRRNIISKNINLNEMIGKIIKIKNIEIKVIDLCEPCNHLQKLLKQENLVKNLLHKGGIRCEILKGGKINIGDKIEV